MVDLVGVKPGQIQGLNHVDKGDQVLLKTANVGQDTGVVGANAIDAFIAAAKTRQWDREKSVRTLA